MLAQQSRKKHYLKVLYILLLVCLVFHFKLIISKFQVQVTNEIKRNKDFINPPRKRIFYCGYRYPHVEFIFPDYEYMGDKPWDGSDPSNDQDILVFGMHGPSCNIDGDEKTAFSGKKLYINGEPYGDIFDGGDTSLSHIYQMGPFPPRQISDGKDDFWNQHSFLIYHVVTSFLKDIYIKQKNSTEWKKSDINPFQYSIENGNVEEKRQERDSKGTFDAWKQLTQGNGYRSISDIPKPEERISAVVYVSRHCVGFRQATAELLAREFQGPNIVDGDSFLHYGGACSPKGGAPVPDGVLNGWENTKRDQFRNNYKTIYTRYKYCLVMENTKMDGYVTEKLLHALLGGCLPIYYGSKDAYKIFRKDSFVYFDIQKPEEALDEIRRLEANPNEYKKRTDRSLPLLKLSSNGTTSETVENFFSLFPSIGKGGLCKQIHLMMGLPLPKALRNSNLQPSI